VGGIGRSASKADNLTISEPIVSQPYGPPWAVTGRVLPFYYDHIQRLVK
jgi:hypothetical protein